MNEKENEILENSDISFDCNEGVSEEFIVLEDDCLDKNNIEDVKIVPDKKLDRQKKKEEKQKLKEQKNIEKAKIKEEKLKIREEKREIRKVKNAERLKKFVFLIKAFSTVLIVGLTGFINSLSLTILGYNKLAMLFVLPLIFMFPAFVIPLIWVKKGSRIKFLIIWLISVLIYIVGFVIPTYLFNFDTISIAFDLALKLLGLGG